MMEGNLKKFIVPVLVLALLAIGIGIIFYGGLFTGSGRATAASLEEMQKTPPADYRARLNGVIRDNPDPYIRERAVFTLTDIALRKNESGMIVQDLRTIALDGRNANLQSAAYANLALIDEVAPQAPQATLDLSVTGAIRPGGTITITAIVSSQKQPTKAIVGISHIPKGVDLSSPQVTAVKIVPGSPVTVPFTLTIRDPGNYKIPVRLLASYSRAESILVQKDLYLQVTAAGGTASFADGSRVM